MIEIKHRFTGAVLYTSEIAITMREALKHAVNARANLAGADLVRANLVRANLTGANLAGADLAGANLVRANLVRANLTGANLAGADLAGADLAGANLTGAYLTGADLTGADLVRANLTGANLAGADLGDQWIIQGQTRSDGYAFFLQRLTADSEPMVKAGCRYFTLAQAQRHWETTRKGQPLLAETRAIVRAMVDTMHIRGLAPRTPEQAGRTIVDAIEQELPR